MKRYIAFVDGELYSEGDRISELDPPRNLNPLPEDALIYDSQLKQWYRTEGAVLPGRTGFKLCVSGDFVPAKLRTLVLILT